MSGLSSLVTLICGLVLSTSFAWACPPAPGQSDLNLAAVMQNFGRFMLPSDRVARSTPAQVSDQELKDAAAGIVTVAECAAIAYKDRTGKLYPSVADSLEGAEKEEYLKSFFAHMKAFHQTLVDYEAEIQKQISTALAQRDFAGIAKQREVVLKAAADAHKELF